MNAEALITTLLELKGVASAALVTADGETVRMEDAGDGRGRFPAGLITSALATAGALGEVLGGEAFRESLIEYEHGAVIMMPLSGDAETGYVAVLALAPDAQPGRVRHQLRAITGRLKRELN